MKKIFWLLIITFLVFANDSYAVQELQANTQVVVRVGPFVDVSDGFTPETGVDLSTADEAELLKHNGAATVSLAAATWAAIASCDGWYDLTLTTSHTDTEGMLMVVVQDDSVCLPVHVSFMVLSQAAWLSKYTAKDSGVMSVDIAAVGGVAVASTVAGVIDSNVTHWEDSAITDADATPDVEVVTKTGFSLADDSITAGTFDESTAFPLKSADTGATAVARTGADSDTLETLSDQVDGCNTVVPDPAGTCNTVVPDPAGTCNTVVPDAAGTLATYDPPTKTEMDTAFTEIKGATFSTDTDQLEDLRNRGDSAWVTATSVTVSDKTGFSLANDSITSSTIASGAIGSDEIAASAIGESELAADCITNSELATTAVTEIAGGIWNAATASYGTSGTYGETVENTYTSAIAHDSDAEIATAVWEAQTSGYGSSGTYGKSVEDTKTDTTAIVTDTAAYDTDAEYAAAIWNAAASGYGGAGTYGQAVEDVNSDSATKTEIATEIFSTNLVTGDNQSLDFAELMRVIGAFIAGETSGGGTTTVTFYKMDDDDKSAGAAITMTVSATTGDRSDVALDATDPGL